MRTIVSLALAAMSLTPAPASHAGTGPTKVVGKTYALPKPFDAFEAIPCAGGAEMKAKPIRALLSRLASLEKDLGRKVLLDLRVKVKRNWRRDSQALRDFGYQ